jgi:diguanylate cyclase (GGDEF)-like protein
MPDTGAPMESPALGESEQLLTSLQTYARGELAVLLDFFFDESESRLIQQAQQSTSSRIHALSFETIGLLKRIKEPLRVTFAGKIALVPRAAQLTSPHASSAVKTNAELELLDLQLLDAQLSLQAMVRRSAQRWSQLVFGVEQRCGYLLQEEIDSDSFALGVTAISRALYDSLIESGVALEMLPQLMFVAERSLMQGLGDIYDELNERMKRAGVLPSLEINQWPELQRFRKLQQGLQSQDGDSNALESLQPSQKSTPIPFPPETHAASRKLLQLLRESKQSSAIPGEAAAPITREALTQVLTALRGDTALAINASLLQRIEEFCSAQGMGPITEENAEQLQLSESVINELAGLLRDVPELAALVQKLQIPVASAALAQPQLFEQADNPAHQLVNTVGELCEASDIRNAPFGHKISQILDPLTRSENIHPAAFATVSAELAKMTEQQLKARERSIHRLVETCDGQQKLAQAQAAVDRELQRRLAHIALPQLIVDLVQNGWRELLRLTYLRAGENSDDWNESLQLLEELLWWFDQAQHADSPSLRAEAEWQQSTQLLSERIKQYLDAYFPLDYRHAALVESIRAALHGGAPIEMATAPFELSAVRSRSQAVLLAELEQAYPDLLRWFRRARDFKVGDIFSHFSDASRNLHTLVWIGTNHQNFVFANARGNKSFDFDLVDLARELASGFYPIGDAANWTVVKRAVLNSAQAAYEKIAFNSSHDELTGLPNRREFEAQLETALLNAKAKQDRYALLYIDIDQFALINDLHGHVVGDAVLRQIGQRLLMAKSDDALLSRMAGNEFALLLRCDRDVALDLAEKLRIAVAAGAFSWADGSVDLTASIGLVEITKYADSAINLLHDAIYATESAKKHGRDRVFLLESDVEVLARRDKLLAWVNKLNVVMESDMLVLRAQPIVRSNMPGEIKHYEILLGLRGENNSVLPPSDFIEAAECYNRMQRVDRWILSHAFAWLGKKIASGAEAPTLSINLSANSLNDSSFLDFLIEQFGINAVPPHLICFEVTETATIDNLANAADFIRQAKKIGCAFALDDFGTGRSSYEYLKQLPVDYLKIDGMFIVNIDKDPNDLLMVKSINEIAHAMGIKTIAEYVEREEILTTLREVGVDYAQGYAVGKPVLLEEL